MKVSNRFFPIQRVESSATLGRARSHIEGHFIGQQGYLLGTTGELPEDHPVVYGQVYYVTRAEKSDGV